MFSDFDRLAMQRALELAARGLTTTDPNPRVGCVIAHGALMVAEGWHERAGEAHAEVVALRAAGAQAAGATVYVTLEPCSHQGRTPPCVEALVGARGAPVRETRAQELKRGFFKRMRAGRWGALLNPPRRPAAGRALAAAGSRW